VTVVVAKNGKRTSLDNTAVANRLFPTSDVIVDELRDVGIVANDDEDRRR
jgi:hypothetical protein